MQPLQYQNLAAVSGHSLGHHGNYRAHWNGNYCYQYNTPIQLGPQWNGNYFYQYNTPIQPLQNQNLAADYRVISLDHHGNSQAQWNGNYSYQYNTPIQPLQNQNLAADYRGISLDHYGNSQAQWNGNYSYQYNTPIQPLQNQNLAADYRGISLDHYGNSQAQWNGNYCYQYNTPIQPLQNRNSFENYRQTQNTSSTVTSMEYQLLSNNRVPCEPEAASCQSEINSVSCQPDNTAPCQPEVNAAPCQPEVNAAPCQPEVNAAPCVGEVFNKQGKDVPDSETAEAVSIKPKHKRGCDNSSMFVKTSDQSRKKLCCPFCDKLYSKLARHLETKHKQEPSVQKILSLPKGSKTRRAIQDSLRKTGTLNHNMNAAANNRELIVSRRPNRIYTRKATDYTTCPYCHGTYRKSAIRHHIRYHCPRRPRAGNNSTGERVTKILGTLVESRHHEKTSDRLAKVFSKLQDGEVARHIKFDWLIIVYGNSLCRRYNRFNSWKMIKNRMRLVGRIFLALNNVNSEVIDFKTLYHPKYYDSLVEAIRVVARLDNDRNEFGAPATASSAVTAVRQIGELLKAEYIKMDDQENQRITENFLTLMNTDIHISISKTVNETQGKMARRKQVHLPTTDDINKLYQYLETEMNRSYNELSKSFSYKKWLELLELTMAYIIVFNRRRVGDTEGIEVEDYRVKEVIDENTNEHMFSTLSDDSKTVAKQFSRMKVRGKRWRTVPVLLKPDVDKSLKLLIRHRQDAGISSDNDMLFALPTATDDVRVVDAGRVLKKFAKACGANVPSLLTGTNMRKHLATACVSMKLNDTSVADVADFMGHAEKVHRQFYRQNPVDRQIVQMSQILQAAQGNSTKILGDGFGNRESASTAKVLEAVQGSCEGRRTKVIRDAVRKRKPTSTSQVHGTSTKMVGKRVRKCEAPPASGFEVKRKSVGSLTNDDEVLEAAQGSSSNDVEREGRRTKVIRDAVRKRKPTSILVGTGIRKRKTQQTSGF